MKQTKPNKPLRVIGLMSGTSADGIDVALAEISGRPPRWDARLVDFTAIPFPHAVRQAILGLGEARATTTGEISQLNFALGETIRRSCAFCVQEISRTD